MSQPLENADLVSAETTRLFPGRAAVVRLGMRIVLLQDLLLFSGLLVLYVVFRSEYPNTFVEGQVHLSRSAGGSGALFLALGSVAAWLGVRAASRGCRGQAVWLLTATFLAGAVFLMIKYGEFRTLIEAGLLPGLNYTGSRHEILIQGHPQIYFSVLYVLMGCHALHVLGAMCGLIWVVTGLEADLVRPGWAVRVEQAGLFWHLVAVLGVVLSALYYII